MWCSSARWCGRRSGKSGRISKRSACFPNCRPVARRGRSPAQGRRGNFRRARLPAALAHTTSRRNPDAEGPLGRERPKRATMPTLRRTALLDATSPFDVGQAVRRPTPRAGDRGGGRYRPMLARIAELRQGGRILRPPDTRIGRGCKAGQDRRVDCLRSGHKQLKARRGPG